MATIKEKVVSFRQWLISNGARRKKHVKMIEQIDKYWENTISLKDSSARRNEEAVKRQELSR